MNKEAAMNPEQYKEQPEVLFYDELRGTQRGDAEKHLQGCTECKSYFDELKKLHGVLAQYSPVEATDQLLLEARTELHSALRDEASRKSIWDRLGIPAIMASPPRFAFAGAVAIAAG